MTPTRDPTATPSDDAEISDPTRTPTLLPTHNPVAVGAANSRDTFLGLSEGVQYVLVGGLLFVLILIVVGVSVCCVAKIKQNELKSLAADSPLSVSTHKRTDKENPVFLSSGSKNEIAMAPVTHDAARPSAATEGDTAGRPAESHADDGDDRESVSAEELYSDDGHTTK